jgi:hypothetical protein
MWREQLLNPGKRGMPKMRTALVVLLALCVVPSVVGQAGDPILTTTVTLSSAQLQHLKAAPAQLVPAPGAHKVVNLISEIAQYKFGTAAYTLGNGGDLDLQLGTTSIREPIKANGFMDQTSNQIRMNSGSGGGSQNGLDDQPLMLVNDGSAEWSDGDGSVIVTVYYTVVDLQ